jgi:uncharacterized protein YggE
LICVQSRTLFKRKRSEKTMQRNFLKPLSAMTLAALAVLIALSLAGGLAPVSAQSANSGLPVNAITVSGSGVARGAPDVAYISLGVDISDADVISAVAAANARMAAITDAVRGAGVAADDIQTISFNVWTEERFDPPSGTPSGERVYRVNNAFNVTVRSIADAGAVIDAALKAGANTVNGLTFGIDDSRALESEARIKAIADARRRAEELAQALGLKVGAPIIVAEVTSGGWGVSPAARADMAMGGSMGPQITPGQLSVTVNVEVTFALAQ